MTIRLSCDNVYWNIAKHRKEGTPEEETTTTKLVDCEASCNAAQEREDGVESVQEQLLISASNADVLQDDRHIVAAMKLAGFYDCIGMPYLMTAPPIN